MRTWGLFFLLVAPGLACACTLSPFTIDRWADEKQPRWLQVDFLRVTCPASERKGLTGWTELHCYTTRQDVAGLEASQALKFWGANLKEHSAAALVLVKEAADGQGQVTVRAVPQAGGGSLVSFRRDRTQREWMETQLAQVLLRAESAELPRGGVACAALVKIDSTLFQSCHVNLMNAEYGGTLNAKASVVGWPLAEFTVRSVRDQSVNTAGLIGAYRYAPPCTKFNPQLNQAKYLDVWGISR